MIRFRYPLLAMIATICAASLCQAELIDNPQYASWAKHKPGTKVMMANEMSMQGMNMTGQMVHTLMEITPEKAVIEIETNMAGMSGMKQRSSIAAKVEKGTENLPPDMKGTLKELGKETIDVAGKKIECTAYEFTGQSQQGSAVSGKMWRSEQIPSGMAKMDMKMEGAVPGTIKMSVTAIETK